MDDYKIIVVHMHLTVMAHYQVEQNVHKRDGSFCV